MNECCDVDEVAVELVVSGWKHPLNHCEAIEVVEACSLNGLSVDQIRRQSGMTERQVNSARRELVASGRLKFHAVHLVREKADA